MWQVEFDRYRSHHAGTLVSSWRGASENTVICLLDPPRNAMPSSNYREAQQNVSKLYALIPHTEPFVVGLQEEFWQEANKQAVERGGPELTETYFENNGFGIVHALSKVKSRPEIIRLEDEELQLDYTSLSSRAIAFMSESASFFQTITSAIKKARDQHFSPSLNKLETLYSEYKQSLISLPVYIRQLREFAESLHIDLKSPRYHNLILFDQVALLEETTVKEEEVQAARNRLAQDIQNVANRGKLDSRAAWEIYCYALKNRYVQSEDAESQVAQIEEILTKASVPAPSAEITQKAIEVVKQRRLVGVRMISMSSNIEDKEILLGDHGDEISNLMELGLVLGLQTEAYPVLTDYIHHSFLGKRFGSTFDRESASVLMQAMLDLEEEVTRRLKPTMAEKILLDLKRVATFLDSLGRFQLHHDAEVRDVFMNLSIFDTCQSLAELGFPVTDRWMETARSLDSRFEVVRDFYDQTLLRAKDLANGLLSAMKQRRIKRGVLCCDGYMRMILERWFKAHEVSHSFVIPDFKVPS